MNRLIKLRSLICILLSIIMFSYSLSATSPVPALTSPTQHKQTMQQFLRSIRLIHSQLLDLGQFSLQEPGLTLNELESALTTLNNDVEKIYDNITEYLRAFPSISEENTQVIRAITALNYIKNEIYYLSLVIPAITDVERIQILNEYFRARLAAVETLDLLEKDLGIY